jgi:hypothetical protein
VQYDERGQEVLRGDVLKDELLVGYARKGLSEPNAPVLFSDVSQVISAHSSREMAVRKRARRVGRV